MLRRGICRFAKYPLMFTNGPVATSKAVQQCMSLEMGSRDPKFATCINDVRKLVLDIAAVDPQQWAVVPMQGNGTMGVEAVIASLFPPPSVGGKTMVLACGAYGRRMAQMCQRLDHDKNGRLIVSSTLDGQEHDLKSLEETLRQEGRSLTGLGMVHADTSTGMVHPIGAVHDLLRKYAPAETVMFVDGMSSFGGYEIRLNDVCDVLVTSANKCLGSFPGVSILLVRKTLLERQRNWKCPLTLDVVDQYQVMERTGLFRHTPPVQVMLALRQALYEVKKETTEKRIKRFKASSAYLIKGLKQYGFQTYLDEASPSFGHTTQAFKKLDHKEWSVGAFRDLLKKEGYLINVLEKVEQWEVPAWRTSSMGDVNPANAKRLIEAVGRVLRKMKILPPPSRKVRGRKSSVKRARKDVRKSSR